MITVGLVNELRFISKALKTPIHSTLKSERMKHEIQIQIKEQVLEIWYLGYYIWKESLDDATTMFGVESCDTLAKIINMIDHDVDYEVWRSFVYIEKA